MISSHYLFCSKPTDKCHQCQSKASHRPTLEAETRAFLSFIKQIKILTNTLVKVRCKDGGGDISEEAVFKIS